jgi:uncharacterized protein
MPMPELPEDLSQLSLEQISQLVTDRHLPPVERWNPERFGHSEMLIARDGTWFHQGAPITRENMVRLFSTILRREADGSYVLVTPSERLAIVVEDAPFLAVEVKNEGVGRLRRLAFRLNTGDLAVAGKKHPLRFGERDGEPAPYLMIRGGMEALIARTVYYELAELAISEAGKPLGLWSDGVFFPMEHT